MTRRTAMLADLRARIRALELGEEPGAGAAAEVIPLGTGEIDAALPWAGLPRGALHEIEAAGATPAEETGAAATGFAAALLARLCDGRGPALWCLGRADLHGPGLPAFGLDPARLIVARARAPREVLWALEEGLRSGRLGAVLGEIGALTLAASRRLQLAARTGVTPCLLLARNPRRRVGTSAAVTRWRVAPAPGRPAGPAEGLGAPVWQVELVRCRGAVAARRWRVEWNHETHRLIVAASLADRPEAPPAAKLRRAV